MFETSEGMPILIFCRYVHRCTLVQCESTVGSPKPYSDGGSYGATKSVDLLGSNFGVHSSLAGSLLVHWQVQVEVVPKAGLRT
jgi:hypothetical protein